MTWGFKARFAIQDNDVLHATYRVVYMQSPVVLPFREPPAKHWPAYFVPPTCAN